MAASLGCMPTYETTSVLPLAGTLMVREPAVLVTAFAVVFFMETVASATGAPLSSVTVPVIFLPCEKEVRKESVHSNAVSTLGQTYFFI